MCVVKGAPLWRPFLLTIIIMPFTPIITTEDVKAVGTFAADDLSIFVTHAETYMDAAFKDIPVDAPLYRLIGVYISAHFAFLKEGQIKSDKVDVLSTTFNMSTGLALNSTTHGQQALALDLTGTLATLNSQAKQSKNSSLINRKGFIRFD